MNNIIYLDNASSTKMSDSVLEAMLPYLKESCGNPGSIHSLGREAAMALEQARRTAAACLGCKPRELFFTSGGSESNNWAIQSAARSQAEKGKRHIITSAFEHHSVLNVVNELEKDGFSVTYLPVYHNGIVRVSDVEKALRSDTALVTVMLANNEIGTIQPVEEIGAICREKGVMFHTDAVGAAGNTAINAERLNVDLLSLSAHKLHGPKGVGLLYCRCGADLPAFIQGGGQESGRRAGTENVAGAVGLAKALEEATQGLAEKQARLTALRDRLTAEIGKIRGAHLNGDLASRLCNNVSFSFEGIDGEALVLQLDLCGIAVSSGSACTSGSLEPSHVLLALGQPYQLAKGSLRITMSKLTDEREAERLLDVLPRIIERLRSV